MCHQNIMSHFGGLFETMLKKRNNELKEEREEPEENKINNTEFPREP